MTPTHFVTHYLDSLEFTEFCKIAEKREHGELYFKSERGEMYSSAFCWPIEMKQRVIDVIKIRMQLKKAYDDSIALVFELRNEVSRMTKN